MDYKEKYEQAVKRARAMIEVASNQKEAYNSAITIFPELKESEDEKIRKEMIFYFTEEIPQCSIQEHADKMKEFIAWLEKQGEKSNWKPSKDEMDALYGLAYITNKMDDKKDEAITKLYQDLKREFFNGATYENMFPSGPTDAPIKDEKQGEHKPADKVEPKFHEGDWLIYENGSIYYVNKVYEHTYELVIDNGDKPRIPHELIDKKARLWTIQDAKDGDVLVCKGELKYSNGIKYERICLFNNLDNAFFALTKTSNFVEEYGIDVNIDYPDNTVPATKEQKEILFMAMKEAGYEWDAEKKELRKIEQKPAEDDDLPEFESHLCLMFQKFRTKGICTNGEIIDYVNEHAQKLKDILVNPTWSEEDDYNLQCMIAKVASDIQKGNVGRNNELIDWLKSLKDRVQPKPKQEWSEEDKKMIIKICQNLYDYPRIKSPFDDESFNEAQKEVQFIKSLTSQSQWKPSEEQMRVLDLAIRCGINRGTTEETTLVSLFNDLKKLKG